MRVMFMFSKEEDTETLEKLSDVAGEKHQVWLTMPVGFGVVQPFTNEEGNETKVWAGLLTDDDVGQIAGPLEKGEFGEREASIEIDPKQLHALVSSLTLALIDHGKPVAADIVVESKE